MSVLIPGLAYLEDAPIGCVKELVRIISTGVQAGDLIEQIRKEKRVFAYAAYAIESYVLNLTVGMPEDVEPIGQMIDNKFADEWAGLEVLYLAETGVKGLASWIQIIMWILSLLNSANETPR